MSNTQDQYKDVINALKRIPRLKHIKENVLERAVTSLVLEVCSKLIFVRSQSKKIILPPYSYDTDEYGRRDEEQITFMYDGRYCTYSVKDIVKNKDGQNCFVIKTKVYLCPLCGEKIVKKTIGGRIIKGCSANAFYKGVHQDMCCDCSNKIR